MILLAASLILGAATIILLLRLGKVNGEIRRINAEAKAQNEVTQDIDVEKRR